MCLIHQVTGLVAHAANYAAQICAQKSASVSLETAIACVQIKTSAGKFQIHNDAISVCGVCCFSFRRGNRPSTMGLRSW